MYYTPLSKALLSPKAEIGNPSTTLGCACKTHGWAQCPRRGIPAGAGIEGLLVGGADFSQASATVYGGQTGFNFAF